MAKARSLDEMSDAELQAAVGRSVVTRIESYGEIVFEPGMSGEEQEARNWDVSYRHGGAERVREAAELHVREGRWTQEQAANHVRWHEQRARELRAVVARFDAERARRAQADGSNGTP